MPSSHRAGRRGWQALTAAIRLQRQWLLLSCLFGGGVHALLSYGLAPAGDAVHLLAMAAFWTLMLAVPWRRGYVLISNLGLLVALARIIEVNVQTGGINSPGMVWMTVLAVLALLLLGRRWALCWMAIVLGVSLVLFQGVAQGWVDGTVDQGTVTVVWAWADKVTVLLSLMWVVIFYDRMHQRRMRELERRNARLQATHKALRQTQAHKDAFMASVGHELRTPMNAILGLNNVLLQELADQPEDLKMARHIRDCTEQLLRLVNDVLDFSRLEAARLQLNERPLWIQQWLPGVLAPYEARAREKSLDFALQCQGLPQAPVLLDGQRLAQVLGNLLDNALKFTDRGGLRVRVHALGERLRVEVEDTGRGIAQEHQEQVFQRFEHADLQTRRAYGGTGLGLAICKSLLQLQGGEIGVSSQPGQGSTFWFELPLRLAPDGASLAQRPTGSPAAHAGLRCLVVDDNAVNRRVAELVLVRCWPDAVVRCAASGQEALESLEQAPADVVFMDMVMPGMDGLETTRRLRRHPQAALARLPVVGLSAHTGEAERERCLQAGMDAVLPKPLQAQQLQETVEQLLAAGPTSSREI